MARSSYGRRFHKKDPLEVEADKLLEEDLTNKRSNKAKTSNILSDSQMARRQRRETPFTDLNSRDKLKLGITWEGDRREP